MRLMATIFGLFVIKVKESSIESSVLYISI